MSGRAFRPPSGQGWVWITADLLASDAWRSMGINARRFIDTLMRENLQHGGRQNGKLKATHRQLEAGGIGARHVTDAIEEAERLGLVDCYRGGQRVATTYALTWLWRHDGSPPTDRWKEYRDPTLPALNLPHKGKADEAAGGSDICPPKGRQIHGKYRNLPHKGKAGLPSEGEADGSILPSEGEADGTENLPSEGKALSRKELYQGPDEGLGVSAAGCPATGGRL